jgi:hypothetical protein
MNTESNPFYEKTSRGREEIATRKYGLTSRLRPLLVLIDGRTSTTEILQKVSGLGLDRQSLAELVNNDFIEPIEHFSINTLELKQFQDNY